jgi:hypothetical protein
VGFSKAYLGFKVFLFLYFYVYFKFWPCQQADVSVISDRHGLGQVRSDSADGGVSLRLGPFFSQFKLESTVGAISEWEHI